MVEMASMQQSLIGAVRVSLSKDQEYGSWLSALGVVHCKVHHDLKRAGEGITNVVTLVDSGLDPDVEERMAQEVVLQRRSLPLVHHQQDTPGLSLIAVPIQAEERTIGVVLLGFFEDPAVGASSFKIGLANLLAHLIGTKLTGIELQRTLTKQDARLNKLVASAVQALKAEREWMRIEVHDGITQNMLSALQHLDTCERALGGTTQEVRGWIHRARTQVCEAVRQSREMINGTGIAPISEMDFATTMRNELGDFQQDTGCQVEFYATEVLIPSNIGLVLYRIAHGAITNVQRRAGSPRLLVKLTHRS